MPRYFTQKQPRKIVEKGDFEKPYCILEKMELL